MTLARRELTEHRATASRTLPPSGLDLISLVGRGGTAIASLVGTGQSVRPYTIFQEKLLFLKRGTSHPITGRPISCVCKALGCVIEVPLHLTWLIDQSYVKIYSPVSARGMSRSDRRLGLCCTPSHASVPSLCTSGKGHSYPVVMIKMQCLDERKKDRSSVPPCRPTVSKSLG